MFERFGYGATFLTTAALCLSVGIATFFMTPANNPNEFPERGDHTSEASSSQNGYLQLLGDVGIMSCCVWGVFAASAFAIFEPSTSLHFAESFPATKPRT
jgi:predicted MFS family arabinose efflux permease